MRINQFVLQFGEHVYILALAATLTGTFFCVTTTHESLPRTATEVKPLSFTALNAYSTEFNVHPFLHTNYKPYRFDTISHRVKK